jgi:RHS repeat-associated protein
MTVRDARGNPVEQRQYHGATPTGNFDATRYTYTDRGDLATVTDAAGNTWTHQYDQRGRRIRTDDPDRGRTTVTYDDAGNVTSTTDARGGTVATTYDELGRRSSVRDGSATGPARAEWAYDTAPGGVGRLASSVRHFGAKDYRTEITGYDAGGRALGTKLVVPAADGFGRTEFLTSSTYKVDGSPATTTLPALGDLAEEKLTFNYNDVGAPTTFLSALSIYAYSVTYDKLGGLTQRVLGNFGSRTAVTYTIDEPTNRLTEAVTTPETKPEAAHFKYTYDPIGNVTRVVDAPAGGATPDTQCYRYDLLRRLTTAWTPASGDCTANPSATALGGPAPYYRDWAYDSTGNRTSEVVHTPTGTTTRSYAQPAAGSRQPHAVQSTSAGDTFGYDPSGNMTSRARAGAAMQNLAWDAEGHLASVTDAAGATSYVYDADGNRLISRTPAGATLYLDDGSEVFAPAGGGAAVGTRYYKHLGVTVAVRKASGLTWIVGDQHQTAEVQISGPNQTVVRRRSLPFGESRGPVQAWVGTRGFVDQPVDGTGLDHLGAREYDPGLGRFISVDPVVNVSDPQTMHGYAYADNNAPSLSDADGRCYGREEGDLCPGQKLGPWAGTVEGDAARDRVFGPTRGKYNNLTGKKNTDGPAKEGEDQQAKWKEIASKIARVLGDAAAVLGFVPGWLCEACAIAGAIMGGIALVLFLVAGELGEALKVAGETVIGFFLGKAAAKTVEKTVIARYGETMLYQARHYAGNLRGQWVRVSRMVPASLRYKMDNIFAVLVGTDGVLAHVAIGGGFGPGHKEE